MDTTFSLPSRREQITLIVLAFAALYGGIYAYNIALSHAETDLPFAAFGHGGVLAFFGLMVRAMRRTRSLPYFVVGLLLALVPIIAGVCTR